MSRLKRKLMVMGLGSALLVSSAFALSDGESLLSKDYVLNTLLPQLELKINDKIKGTMEDGYEDSVANLDALQQQQKENLSLQVSQVNTKVTPMDYGQGDVVQLSAGATVLVTDGRIQLVHDGVVIDATTGQERSSGSYGESGHRYIVGEDTKCTVTVISGLATMGYEGVYSYAAGAGKNQPFYDVYSTDSYNDAVTFVYHNGLFEGVGDGIFAPGSSMNRAMVVTVLYRLAGEPLSQLQDAKGSFVDVPTNEWYTDYVLWASSQGVTQGVGDGRFAPTKAVTQFQMMQFLYNFGSKNLGLPLSGTVDLSTVSGGNTVPDWASEAVQWAVASGVWTEKLSGDNASRGQVATMLMNFTKIYG